MSCWYWSWDGAGKASGQQYCSNTNNDNGKKRCKSRAASSTEEDTDSPILIWTDIANFKDQVHKFTGMSSSSSIDSEQNLLHSSSIKSSTIRCPAQRKQRKQSSGSKIGNSNVLKPTPKRLISQAPPSSSASALGLARWHQIPPLFGGPSSSSAAAAAASDSFVNKSDSCASATADASEILSWLSKS